MKVTITLLKDRKKIDEIINIHMKSFSGFFLTFLGKGFLKQLYKGFLIEKNSNLIVALSENGKVLGFLAYSSNLSAFYKFLIKKYIFFLGWYAIIGFFKNPKIFFRLIRAFTYSKAAKRRERYVEISSIGVDPENGKKGIGSKMINYLKKINFEDFHYIKLETDAINNEYANNFYKKNNFILEDSYLTPEGRKMNEYRYYLNSGDDK